MYRLASCTIIIACLVVASSSLSLAANVHTAKVYRDYPGYIETPTCLNPRMASQVTETAQSTSEDPAASTTNSGPGHLYAGVYAGGFSLTSGDIDSAADDIDVEYDLGYAAALVMGYDFGAFRFDLQGSYGVAGVDEVTFNGLEAASIDGDIEVTALILNGYYDFTTNENISPYLGIGVGVMKVALDSVEAGNVEIVDDDDDVMAGQLSAGVLFAINESIVMDVGYRCLITEDVELNTPFGAVETSPVSHAVMFGLQFNF